jgi:hypothetical protein
MRWTPRGARLLLQIRTRVLNDQLADDFRRWYRRPLRYGFMITWTGAAVVTRHAFRTSA